MTKRLILRVSGVTFQNRQAHLAILKEQGIEAVWLEPDPDNPYDRWAIKVIAVPRGLFQEPLHVGYVPRDLTWDMDPKDVQVVRAWIVGVKPLGMRLEVVWRDAIEQRFLNSLYWQPEPEQPEPATEPQPHGSHGAAPHEAEKTKEGASTMREMEVWVAVAFKMAKTGESMVMVGRDQHSWVIRVDSPVPKAVAQNPAALAAIRQALAGEVMEVNRIGQARERYLELINGLQGAVA